MPMHQDLSGKAVEKSERSLSQPRIASTSNPVLSSSPNQPSKSSRGFASMDKDRQRQIASLGGKSVKAQSRVFFTNRQLAIESGRKGGRSIPPEKRAFSQDRKLAARAGQLGGRALAAEKRSFALHPEWAKACGRKGGLRRKV